MILPELDRVRRGRRRPGGARPSYAHGYYARDNSFYFAWDKIARDREYVSRVDAGERR